MAGSESVGRYKVEAVVRVEPLGRVLRARAGAADPPLLLRELCPPASLPHREREALVVGCDTECRAAAAVAAPGMVRAVDWGITQAGGRFLAYEEPTGGEWLSAPAPDRPLEGWLLCAAAAARCMEAARAAGLPVVTLDPDELLAAGGEVRGYRLTHAHLARVLELAPGRWAPRPHAAPEMLEPGPIAPAALVYSTASWLYQSLTGRPVAPGQRPEAMWRLRPGVPAAVDTLLQRALSPDPADRAADLPSFARALEELAGSERTIALPASRAPGGETPGSLLGWGIGLAAAGTVVGWLLSRGWPLP